MVSKRVNESVRLKIATWNVHRCIGTDRKYDPDRVAHVLNEIDADIVALQEVDTSLKGRGDLDQLALMANVTGFEPIYGATREHAGGHFGNAFLHKHRASKKQTLNLSYRKYEPRGALAVQFEFGSRTLRVVNTHLGLKAWERAFQISTLLSQFGPTSFLGTEHPNSKRPESYCLLGDFNEWFPFSFNLLRLQTQFHRTPRLRTFPSVWPRFALDRIFFCGTAATSLKVFDTPLARKASDHLPLVAEFEI